MSHLQVSSLEFGTGASIDVSVDVTNTGDVAGKEVVQVYVRDVESKLQRPPKELKGFAKVALEPGETKTVTITLNERAFMYYNAAYPTWIAEAGDFDILVGTSAADICLTQRVTLTESTDLPSLLNAESVLAEWMEDPRGAKAIEPIMQQMAGAFGSDDTNEIGMDPTHFLKDLPLTVLLRFFDDGSSEVSPEDIVAGMISQVNSQS